MTQTMTTATVIAAARNVTKIYGSGETEVRALRGVSLAIDNFGTLILYYTGSCSDDGNSRVMSTQFNDPIKGGTIHYKGVYSWIDDDHFNYEAFMDKGDGEFKNLEIAYERQ